MKKTVAVFLGCVLLAGLFVAGAAAAEKHKVYLITMDQMDQHWVTVNAGAEKAVAELGNIDYKWLAPDVKDDAKQIEAVNNAVAGGAHVLLVAAKGRLRSARRSQEASEAGVKIVTSTLLRIFRDSDAGDRKRSRRSYCGQREAEGARSGRVSEGKIGIVNVNAATASTVAREKGFRAAFAGTKFELLETQYCDGDAARAKDIASNYITQGCVGIFGANEGSTVGTGNAIQEAGGKVIGVGFDKSNMILGLIKNGFLVATMAQNPDVMGYEGVKTAARALAGEPAGPAYVDTGVSVLTKNDL